MSLTFPRLSSINVYVNPSLAVNPVLVSVPLVIGLLNSIVYVAATANVVGAISI